jgi:hypothetical protein
MKLRFSGIILFILTIIAFSLNATTWEIKYDNGIAYVPNYHSNPGNGWAVLFDEDIPTPSGYIQYAKIYVSSPDETHQGCYISIYKVQSGEPGDLYWGPQYFNTQSGWNMFLIDLEWEFGNFLILFQQIGYYPDCDGVYNDTRSGNLKSWKYIDGGFERLTNKNLMIRTIWGDEPIAITTRSLGSIKTLFK